MTIQERVQEHYDEVMALGYEVVGVFLQGSQNYKLEYEGSDVDTKAILLPTFDDFCLNRAPISTTHVRANNEHTDFKDVRLMFDCFKKQNINFVEILFTEYKVMNPKYETIFQMMIDNRELIAHYNNYAAINCMAGMSMEKFKALEHPYPATMDKIEKFGYDPKQLHHIIRINEFMKRYIAGEPYAACLHSNIRHGLIEIKKGFYDLESARMFAKEYDNATNEMKKEYMANNPVCVNSDAEIIMNSTIVNLMKHYFREELRKTF